jgi:hypothetical protein
MIRLSQTQSIASLVAEYDTIVMMADGPRWDAVLSQSGLNDAELTQAKASPAYPVLLALLRDVESRGFDVHTELPLLVTGRSFDNADDVASVLQYRINRYVNGMGYPAPSASELVAGIFPGPRGFTDPDVVFALNDRADAIKQRAHELATIAIERCDTWVRNFGDAPRAAELYEQWVLEVAIGAAYFDRWGIDIPDSILYESLDDYEQEAQRNRVLSAAQRACALEVVEEALDAPAYVLSADEFFEPPNQDFGLNL